MTKRWPTVRLSDILTPRIETPAPDDLATGKVRIISKIAFGTGRLELRMGGETKTGMILARSGDLVVSGINAAKGAIAVYDNGDDQPIAATIHYGAYIPNKDRASVKYLWWLLRSSYFQDLLLEYVPGGIKTELKAKRLLPIPVPLPPLAEQERLVARIEILASRIAEARILREEAERQADVLIGSALTPRIVELRERFGTAMLGEVTITICDINHEMPRAVSSGVPFVSPKDFTADGAVDMANAKRISQSDFERLSRKCCPRRGDVLIARYGTVGATRSVQTDEQFLASYSVAVIRPDPQKVETGFLHWMLISPDLQGQIRIGIRGGIQADMGLKTIRRLEVPVPPKAEQARFTSELDALRTEVGKLRRVQTQAAAELDALLPSILDRAFRGEQL